MMRRLVLLPLAATLAMGVTAMGQTTWYVDDDAPLGGDGASWTSAFTYLQDALTAASPGDEIRVGAGVYKPDQDEGGNVTAGDRTATFQLITGVVVRGGYAGYGASDPNERRLTLYETTLSGDLLGDDLPGLVNNGDNSYHVVTGSATDQNTILDGFTIAGGNAEGGSVDGLGGAVLIDGGDLTIANCIISGNRAYDGGGVACLNSSAPMLINCAFVGNVVGPEGLNPNGAALNVHDSSPTILNCTFSGNTSMGGSAGGMYIVGGSSMVRVTNCVFWDNSDAGGTDESAQIHVDSGTAVVVYCCVAGLDTLAGSGNIGEDPLLTVDGHLSPGSPCIDAGDTSALPVGLYVDLGGRPRVVDDACSFDTGIPALFGASTVDMGAYEYRLGGDLDADGDVDLSDLSELLANYGAGCASWEYYDGHYYRLTDPRTWEEAEAEAIAAGGHLVAISGAEENQWIQETFGDENCWIGLYQIPGSPEPDGGWVWSNGESVDYVNWCTDEPNNDGDEGWAEIKGTGSYCAGRWNDLGASNVLRGVIERN